MLGTTRSELARRPARVGLMIPSSNTMMEVDFAVSAGQRHIW